MLTELRPGVNAITIRGKDAQADFVVKVRDAELGRASCGANEECRIFLSRSLEVGDAVRIVELVQGDPPEGDCVETPVSVPGSFDWGRVRGDFTGGVVMSKDREEFSKADALLAATVTTSWFQGPVSVYTYADLRLTSLNTPDAPDVSMMNGAETPPSDPSDPAEEQPNGQPDGEPGFTEQPKAAVFEIGLLFPVRVAKWEFGGKRHSMFVAPIGKVGRETIREEVAAQLGDDVTNYWAVGLRFGHHEGGTSGSMPLLLSYLDITRGKWERYESVFEEGGPVERRARWGVEGRILVPGGLALGVSLNFGEGRDDFRLLITKVIDLGTLLEPLL